MLKLPSICEFDGLWVSSYYNPQNTAPLSPSFELMK
jgi:hypothetical protein